MFRATAPCCSTLPNNGRGDLDPEVVRICKDMGAWLKVNGEAVYGSRPFEVFGSEKALFTRNKGNVYVTLLDWNGASITLSALQAGGATLGKVSKVELLGSDLPLKFIQDDKGLTITPEGLPQVLPGITDQSLASKCRVLRITHDKDWFNDDDSRLKSSRMASAECNLGTGDFNNDLTTSDTPGDIWTCSFTGSSLKVIAPKEPGAGKIEIQIDGKTRATVDLSITGTRQAQQVVFEISGMKSGKHTVNIINRGSGPVAVDALKITD